MLPEWYFYFIRIIIVLIAFIIVSIITYCNIKSWYFTNAINRPPQAPSPIFFGFIWIILYLFYAYVWCMAYSLSGTRYDLLFGISLLFNVLWVIVFFGMHDLILSRIIIVILLFIVLVQAYIMWQLQSGLGAFLLLVYAAWLVCATALNFNTSYNTCRSGWQIF